MIDEELITADIELSHTERQAYYAGQLSERQRWEFAVDSLITDMEKRSKKRSTWQSRSSFSYCALRLKEIKKQLYIDS